MKQGGVEVVSSEELANHLGLTSVQIRKDLAYFGEFGQRGVGYQVAALWREILQILGADRVRQTALVGLGNLGRALSNFAGLKEYGVYVTAIFDSDQAKVGQDFNGIAVRPISEIETVVSTYGIKLAVLTVPAKAAQEVTDRLVRAGVKAIWNFAPVRLVVPAGVEVRQENLTVGLLALSYYLARSEE
jgi:redox-sensing transcriptional repressor